MKKRYMTLVALVWATCANAQIIPDYGFKLQDTNAVPNTIAIVLAQDEYAPMVHDTIQALYKAGRDEDGLAKLVRWKSALEQAGDTTSLDYSVVLVDLGLAMYQLGNFKLAAYFEEKVLQRKDLRGTLGTQLQAKAAKRLANIHIARGNLAESAKMRDFAHIGEEYAVKGAKDLKFEDHGENMVAIEDSIINSAAIEQLGKVKQGIEDLLQHGPSPALERVLAMVAVTIHLHQLHYDFGLLGDVDYNETLKVLADLRGLKVKAGLQYANYLFLADLWSKMGRTRQALALVRHTRQVLETYASNPKETHFELIPYYVSKMAAFEASFYTELHEPEMAIRALWREPIDLQRLLSYGPARNRMMDHTQEQNDLPQYGSMYRMIAAYLDPKLNDAPQAYSIAIQAVRYCDRMLGAKRGDQTQLWVAKDVLPLMQIALVAASRQIETSKNHIEYRKSVANALTWAEGFRGQQLESLWEQSFAVHGMGVPDSIRSKIDAIRAKMQDLQAQRYLGNAKVAANLLEEAALQAEEQALFKQHLPANKYPTLWNGVGNRLQLEMIQSRLASDEALIYYYEGFSYIFRFTIEHDSLHFAQIQRPGWEETKILSLYRYSRQIRSLSEPFQPVARYQANATAMQALLWPWKDPAHAPKRVAIFPDGLLWSIPFDALTYPSEPSNSFQDLDYLVRHHEINYWPGLKMWEAARHFKPTLRNAPTLSICPGFLSDANPVMACDTPSLPLPNAPLQILHDAHIQLQRKYNGEFLVGNVATERATKKGLENAGILSIASHAVTDEVDPLASYIALYPSCEGDQAEDGRLHAYEIYRHQFPVELVMLWGCNTGGGKQAIGEGLLSLARAFVASGAKSVLMSQWKMDEAPTARMMELYFQGLAAGQGKARALQQAKLQFIDEAGPIGAEPYRWAGWALVGDAKPLVTEFLPRSPRTWAWALVAAALMAGTWIVYKGRRKRS